MILINYLITKFAGFDATVEPPQKLGALIACIYLKKIGYVILEKYYRSRYSEIDIVAKDSDTGCFIEVKSRSNTDFALPEEYVDKRKQKKLLKTSMIYLSDNKIPDINKRFDVISVDLKNSTCRKIINAFEVEF